MDDIVHEMLNQIGDDVIIPEYKIQKARDKYDNLHNELEQEQQRSMGFHRRAQRAEGKVEKVQGWINTLKGIINKSPMEEMIIDELEKALSDGEES